MSKKSKLILEKERLKLRLEQQKYVVYRDYVKLKDTYHPMKVATDTVLKSLSDGRLSKQELTPLEQQELREQRNKRIGDVRDLVLQLFMFAESFLVPPSDRKKHAIQRPSSRPISHQETNKDRDNNVDDQYIIGKDDR